MFDILTQLEAKGRHNLYQVNRWSKGWFLLLVESIRDVLSFKSSLYAAATAYFTLFSIFPLVLLTVAIASFWFEPILDEELILQQLEFVIPAINDLFGANLERIIQSRGVVTRLSAITLIWSASSMFYMLTRAMDAIWEGVMVRPAWRHRALAIIFTLGISVLLFAASVAWGIVVPIINRSVPEPIVGVSPYLNSLGAAALSVVLFTVLYRMLPRAKLRWRDVIVGAVMAGLLWELAKQGFLYFVSNYLTLSNLIYGSVTTIIALLTWAYLSSLIFLFGAHVNVRYRRLRQDRQGEGL